MSCKIGPEIKNKEGKFVDSKLFKDLLSHTSNDRDLTKIIYNLSKNREFIFSNKEIIKYDELNEPTLESILSIIDLDSLLKGGALINKYSKELHTEKIYEDLNVVLPIIREFNSRELSFIASYEKEGNIYKITVLPKNGSTFNTSQNLEEGTKVSKAVENLFKSIGLELDLGQEATTVHGFADPLLIDTTINDINALQSWSNEALKTVTLSKGVLSFLIDSLESKPITQRLVGQYLSLDIIKEVLRDSYSIYNEYYKGDFSLLAKEAVIQDLQKYLIGEKIVNKKANLLLDKFSTLIKDTFLKIPSSDFKEFNTRVKDSKNQMENTYNPKDSNKKIVERREPLSKFTKRVSSKSQTLRKIIEDSIKIGVHRYEIYKRRNTGKGFTAKEEARIKGLRRDLASKNFIKGITDILVDANSRIDLVANKLDEMHSLGESMATDPKTLNMVAYQLREAKDFTHSYAANIQSIMRFPDMVRRGELDMSIEEAEELAELARSAFHNMNRVFNDYTQLAKDVFTEFLRPYFKEEIVIDRGKRKGEKITLEMVLSSTDRDINFLSRFLNSAADSGDLAVQLIDKVIKIAHVKKQQKIDSLTHRLRRVHHTFLEAGGTDTKFMYELDEKGIAVGYYISDRDFGKYIVEKRKFLTELDSKGLDILEHYEHLHNWEQENSDYILIGEDKWEKVPKKSLYPSNALEKLTPAQKKYYDSFLKIKQELDNMLPDSSTETYRAIQFMNSATEAVFQNLDAPGYAIKTAFSTSLDGLIKNANDTDFGVQSLKDFAGREVQTVPIHYTEMLPDMKRLSLDSTSALAAFGEMAINYDELHKVLDVLELGRDVIAEREVAKTRSGKVLYQKVEGLGEKIVGKLVEKGEGTNITKRIDELYSSNLYGRRKKDEGSFNFFGKEISIAKTGDLAIKATSWGTMGLNLLADLNNVTVGKFQMFLEGIAGEYFTYKDIVIGDKNYFKYLPEMLLELGSSKKSSKLGLFQEKFDVFQDFGTNAKNQDFYKKSLLRMFGKTASVYIGSQMGENYMQTRTLLAYANTIKLIGPNGKKVSLFDAYEKVNTMSNGTIIDTRLKLKDGYTKLDGTAFTEEDISDVILKVGKINQSLHGIYNELDRNVLQKWVMGRALMQFRKWMIPHYNRRYRRLHYDFQLGQWKEGFYRSFPNVLKNIAKDLGHGQLYAGQNWQSMTSNEKANFKRGITEIGTALFLWTLINFVTGDYDDKKTWAGRIMMYQLYRLNMELGVSVPNPFSMWKDGMNILKSPSATLSTIEDYFSIIKFWDLWDIVERGRFEGHSEYYRNFMTSMPVQRNVQRVMDITTEDYPFLPFVN